MVTDNWRMKLLAIGLAVLMLGAVAFSQNPPTTGSLTVPLNYAVPPNLILINPPAKINVTYSGLAGVIKNVNTSNLTASVDATRAKPGPAVSLNVTVKSFGGVNVQSPPPIAVEIDTLQSKDLPVQVIAHAAPGWSVTKAVATCLGAQQSNPCVVHFTGPASWETSLSANVQFSAPVNVSTIDSPTQTVQLQNTNGPLDLSSIRTVPPVNLDFTSVSVHIEAVAGSTSSTVALVDSPPSHPPAAGYRITAITITPNTVILSGDPAALGRIRSITLPAVDLSGRTSDATFQVAIPYPDGISGSAANAKVTYSISANPNVSPTP